MSGVTIIEPVAITDASLVSSNITENDHEQWSSTKTYDLGARVILASTHKIYESVQAANIGKDPSTQAAWWSVVRPTNKWAVFDLSNSTKTITNGGDSPKITYEIRASSIDSVAVLNINEATSVTVTMTSSDGDVVYTKNVSLLGIPYNSDWWSWFFGERTLRPTQVILSGLPLYVNAIIKIELEGSSELSAATIIIGRSKRIGVGVLTGARVGIQDYSRKEKTDYGDTILVERAFARRVSFNVLISAIEVDTSVNYLAGIRAKPCLWISGSYESASAFGFYKTFDILIQYSTHSELSIEIEGLT